MPKLYIVVCLVIVIASAACGNTPVSQATPTLVAIQPSMSPTLTNSDASLITPTDAPVSQVVVSSPTPTPTLAPPTATFTPSPTSGPYTYTVQANDTLGYIIQQFGYRDLSTSPGSIIDQVVRMNDSIQSADILPGPGTVILIPRQTSTPTPENAETAVSVQATDAVGSANIPEFSSIDQYIVQPDDTIVGIAQSFDTTLGVLFNLNPDLPGIFSCNPEIPSGGPNCNVTLKVGQSITVPAPTPTPTLSPTPSGNETATPTATFAAPVVIFPPEGASAGAGVFNLQWVGVGMMDPDLVYLVQVTDVTDGRIVLQAVTRDTSYLLPDNIIPTDGKAHTFAWMVWIARPNADKVYGRVGGEPTEHIFIWQSR